MLKHRGYKIQCDEEGCDEHQKVVADNQTDAIRIARNTFGYSVNRDHSHAEGKSRHTIRTLCPTHRKTRRENS